MPVPQFCGLPRQLDVDTPDGKAYVDGLRDNQKVTLQVFVDGREVEHVKAYDQDAGWVRRLVVGPLGLHANPEVLHGRVTLKLKAIEPPAPGNPYGWFGVPFPLIAPGVYPVTVGGAGSGGKGGPVFVEFAVDDAVVDPAAYEAACRKAQDVMRRLVSRLSDGSDP